MHLVYKYQKVDSNTRIKVLISLTNDSVNLDNNTVSTSTMANKKQKLENSINID
ncbi:10366_t:CDS:1, partial [Cetraspora pellucida]